VIMRALPLAALAFGLFIPGAASAQAKDCANATTQLDMNVCAAAAQKSADQQLNKTYNTLIARIADQDAIALLRNAEKAWLAYRDQECTFETSMTVGGSVHPMMVAQCLEAKTRARTQELQQLLNCQEGDLSCVPLKSP